MSCRFLVLAAVGLLGACSSARRTAEQDLNAAQDALTAMPAEARDIVPDQVAILDEALKVGNQAIATKDYASASTSLHAIPAQVKLITDSLPARKAALQAEMDTLEIVVPRNLDAIRGEFTKITRTGKRPASLDKKGLADVRMMADSSEILWKEVKAEFGQGKLADAMAKAQDLKGRVSRVLLQLGLVADDRAWSNVTLPPKP
jgi:hypothetical protein